MDALSKGELDKDLPFLSLFLTLHCRSDTPAGIWVNSSGISLNFNRKRWDHPSLTGTSRSFIGKV